MAKGLIAGAAAALLLAAAAAAPAAELPQVDLSIAPLPQPQPGQAMVVMRFHAPAMAGDNRVSFHRWDAAAQAIVRDAAGQPEGFRTTFSYSLFGGKKGVRELRVAIVPAGDYVLAARTVNAQATDTFCFGGPRFTVAPGSVTYVGDFEMLVMRKAPDRELRNGMKLSSAIEETRTALAAAYPEQAARLAAWSPVNGTRFACDGDEFFAYAVPGAPDAPAGSTVARAPAALPAPH